ncbi:DUF3515 domain-containing protein [Nocardia sp. NPDC052254]|uniref:DUF3515 domain-containing protein n=1 Tax=Nocardia sp. NPDC052254 TaxID=3155681 RepID=UPI003445825C
MSSDTDRPDTDTPSADRPAPEHGPRDAETPAEPTGTASASHPGATAETGTADPAESDAAADDAAGASEAESEPDAEPEAEASTDSGTGPQLHPALIATAVALPVALIVAVLVIAVMSRQSVDREPLALSAIDAPAAGGQECAALLAALPASLSDDYTRSELVQPAPPATVAWQLPDGGDPIVLRCGLQRPQEFDQASALQVVNGVNWFEVRDETSGVTSGTWYAVDRGTYIAVTMPNEAGPSPLQEISNMIAEKIPAKPLDPGPVPN